MKVESGIAWGKGEYECLQCSTKKKLENDDEILEPCMTCGCCEFDCKVSVTLSKTGLSEKISNSLTILEAGVFLYEVCKLDEFLPIIAGQLRILFCDTQDNSLIPKVHEKYMFFPISGSYLRLDSGDGQISTIIMENELFDEKKEQITIDEWLNQIIYKDETNSINLTIREVIRTWADKNGGAHVDEKKQEKNLYAIAFFKEHLIEISKFIVKSFGYDCAKDIMEKIITPIEKLKLKV